MSPHGKCIAVLPTGLNFSLFMRFLVIMSKPQKVKKISTWMPSPSAALASTRPGYAMSRLPLEQTNTSLRSVSSSSKLGTMGTGLVSLMVMSFPDLDAAGWLGQPSDVRHLLGGLLGEERELLLDGHPARGLNAPGGGGLALDEVVLTQEPDESPVRLGHFNSDLRGELGSELLGPLVVLGHEALVVDVNFVATQGGRWHGLSPLVRQ